MRLSLLVLAASLAQAQSALADSSSTIAEQVAYTSVNQDGMDQPSIRRVQEYTGCYEEFTMYFKGDCNLDIIMERIDLKMEEEPCHHSTLEEVAALLHMDSFNITDFDDLLMLDEEVIALCRTAMDDFAADPKSSLSWDKVTEKGVQFDKSYYDGGTYWNEEHQTDYDSLVPGSATNVLEKDAERVEDLFETVADRRQFEFPTHLENFESCEIRAAMCCWVQDRQAGDNNGNCKTPYDENCIDKDPADNTDLCAVDFERSGTDSIHLPGGPGFAVYPGGNDDGEGPTHCHGFAWDLDEYDLQSRFKGNNLFYVSMYDHMSERGYVRNVPGAPMCGCVEKMPLVTQADCTEIEALEIWKLSKGYDSSLRVSLDRAELSFNACDSKGNGQNNDLQDFYKRLKNEGRATEDDYDKLKETLVRNVGCDQAVHDLFYEKGYELNPELPDWSQVYGRGQYEYPENTFNELWADWSPTSYVVEPTFYVRRLCHSCSDSHNDIIYKRLTPVPEDMDVRDLFLANWMSKDNQLGSDFNLFSSFEDAVADTNPWKYCNYDDGGIGFPRDCGPEVKTHSQWNSLTRGGETDFAFYVWNDNPHYDAPTFSPTVDAAPMRNMEHPGAEGYALHLQDSLGYMLAYEVNLEQSGEKDSINYQKNGNVYSTDVHNELPHYLPETGFERIAYYMELESWEYGPQWIWVSMDAFTDDLDKVGVPTFDSDSWYDGEVSGLNVFSNVEGLSGEDMTGRVEFWPWNYGANNEHNVEGASSSKFDFGDDRSTGGNYGSMQVHSLDLQKTMFAFNYWNNDYDEPDIGIGSCPDPSENPDWTFTRNMNIYTTKKLQVFVRGPATIAPSMSNAPTKTATPTRLMSEEYNIALGRPTEQKCQYYTYDSSRAVDGDVHSYSMTCRGSDNEWWKVNLDSGSVINKIVVLNRIDCCQYRLDYANVEILDESGEVLSVQNVGKTSETGEVVFFYDGIQGSAVRVALTDKDYLTLAEVRVYGHTPTTRGPTLTPTVSPAPTTEAYGELSDTINLATGGTATQSTTCYKGTADRAIDGHTNGNFSGYPYSVTHTCREDGQDEGEGFPWWIVHLSREDDIIEKITVWNRMDCCSDRLEDSLVQILDAEGKVIEERQIGASFDVDSFEFEFDSVVGAAVKVMMTNAGELSLAEVIVEGKRHIGV